MEELGIFHFGVEAATLWSPERLLKCGFELLEWQGGSWGESSLRLWGWVYLLQKTHVKLTAEAGFVNVPARVVPGASWGQNHNYLSVWTLMDVENHNYVVTVTCAC